MECAAVGGAVDVDAVDAVGEVEGVDGRQE